MGPHHRTRKGKRVLVITKEGRRIVDRFVEHRDSFVVLEQAGRIPMKDIRSLSDYKPYPQRRAKAALAALAVGSLLGLGACATSSEEELRSQQQQRARQREDSFRPKASAPAEDPAMKSIPVREVKTPPPAAATQPAPPPPPAPVQPPPPPPKPAPPTTPVSTASPYVFVSPWIGKWAYQEDPSFVMELGEDGKVTYGQLWAGTFDLLDGGKVLQLKLVGQQGLVQGRTLAPVLFTLEYAEGGNVLVLRNGGNLMVLRRK